jgi:HAD superfamily hydrolase (TIGR01509 family)
MITTLLWDHDGVLVDTEHLYFRSTREALADVGVNLTVAQYRQWLLVEARGAWHLAREKGVSEQRIEALRKRRNESYEEMVAKDDVVVSGAMEWLVKLRSFYRMAVVTSSRRGPFDAIHGATPLRRLVQLVLTREDYENSKPDPEPYLLAMQRLGVKPQECLVIEDSQRGLQAALDARVPCWIIKTQLTAGLDFRGASRCFDDLDGVGRALLEQARKPSP